ncbi:hypothetical protein V6N11_033870 [Hibiscus sabdariffa]|uniref:Uncharacterized protein n=1 Tax=Hibiscus sabdariffa TaxID=183260 RepID=A0ABR2S0U6_9ROSI
MWRKKNNQVCILLHLTMNDLMGTFVIVMFYNKAECMRVKQTEEKATNVVATATSNGVPHILYWVKSEVSSVYSRLKSKRSSNRPKKYPLLEGREAPKVNESLEEMEASNGRKVEEM